MYIIIFARLLLVLGGINYLLNFFDINLISKSNFPFVNLLFGLVGLYFLFDRDYYLPFLGKCAFPITQNVSKNKNNLTSIKLSNLPPNTTIVAWGAKESDKVFDNPFDAYENYDNTTIIKSNEYGEAIVDLNCPSEYTVNNFGIIKKINKHIHYRYELPEYKGLFSKVFTRYLNEKCQ